MYVIDPNRSNDRKKLQWQKLQILWNVSKEKDTNLMSAWDNRRFQGSYI